MTTWNCLRWAFTFALLASASQAFPQTSQLPQLASPEEVVSRVSPSVVLILVGQNGSEASGLGSGLIVQPEGIILTSYHLVQDAKQMQIRLKNGEVFDNVELLGFDVRRDIAALRIATHGLPTLRIAKAEEAKPGEAVYVVSHPGSLSWTASSGILSAIRLADEVPGAGSGYRLLQFTAAISPGSSGGALVDGQGQALGIVVGATEGQNLNFAVPIESVLGLSRAQQAKAYASGSDLKLPEKPKPAAAASAATPPQESKPEVTPAPTNQAVSEDPLDIARNARTIYIRAKPGGAWSGFPAEPLEKKLLENKEFLSMGLVIVNHPQGADLQILLERPTMSWDCTYRMTHPATGMVLGAGKDIAWDCIRAAPAIADQIVKRLKQLRAEKAPEAGAVKQPSLL